MSGRQRPRARLCLVLPLALTIAAVAGPALSQTSGVGVVTAVEPVAAPGASLNPLAHLSLETMTETRAAPLFSPTRAKPEPPPPEPPPEEVAIAAPEPAEEPQPAVEPAMPNPFTLIGVVLGPTREQALLRDGTTGQVLRLAAGESAGGWTLVAIAPREVEIERDGRRETLKLFTGARPAAPAPMPAAAPAPQPAPPGQPIPEEDQRE